MKIEIETMKENMSTFASEEMRNELLLQYLLWKIPAYSDQDMQSGDRASEVLEGQCIPCKPLRSLKYTMYFPALFCSMAVKGI